ncbi:MAG: PDZ domain-containing protein [Clostridium sp.]|jgi:serine protease Do|nr:PDZ domain-containing protein [Clostridium sp.]
MYDDKNNTNDNNYVNYNSSNQYTNPNFTFVNNDNRNREKVENRKKNAKLVSAVSAGVIVALLAGSIGSYTTYNIMKNDKVVSSVSYAPPEFASSSDGSLTISDAFEKVKPAVVTISTKSIQELWGGLYSQEVEGLGSGFIINEDGYILTNYHVIQGSKDVKVLLSNGKEALATVVNYDSSMDIAMIKLQDGTEIPGVAELGDSDALYPGEDVIAIGTPLSKEFAQTLTKGVISAVGRQVESESGNTLEVIQTDAAINAGNSGGPLVNTKGQVIGINSMKLGNSGSSSNASIEGMGFSIPINVAKERIDSLSKPILTLGISIIQIDSEKAAKTGHSEGLYVKTVTEGSPAEAAGIKQGDIIVEFDGKRVKTYDELNKLKSKKQAGDTVNITVERNNQKVDLQLTLQAESK